MISAFASPDNQQPLYWQGRETYPRFSWERTSTSRVISVLKKMENEASVYVNVIEINWVAIINKRQKVEIQRELKRSYGSITTDKK